MGLLLAPTEDFCPWYVLSENWKLSWLKTLSIIDGQTFVYSCSFKAGLMEEDMSKGSPRFFFGNIVLPLPGVHFLIFVRSLHFTLFQNPGGPLILT